jgi:hypothetical protein
MSSYVLGFQDIDKTKIMVVGGKGANLGEISKAAVRTPPFLPKRNLNYRSTQRVMSLTIKP